MSRGTQQVRVPARWGLSTERTLTLIAESDGRWEVFDEQAQPLGSVFKSTYTYSPPLHRGSRIVRYHHRVKCWKNSKASHRQHWPTRQEALAALLLAADEETKDGADA